MQSNSFIVLILIDDIILHTIPNNVPPFRMQNVNQKHSLYQLLIFYCVGIPTQGIHLDLILTILSNIHPVILPTIFCYDNLLFIQVDITLFWHLFLQNIHWYLLNITQTIKSKINTYLFQVCNVIKHQDTHQ